MSNMQKSVDTQTERVVQAFENMRGKFIWLQMVATELRAG